MIMGLDRTGLIMLLDLFLVRSFRVVDKLVPGSFLLHAQYSGGVTSDKTISVLRFEL